MVWRVPYPTGGPPVPTLFWALALLAFERWFDSILAISNTPPNLQYPPSLNWPHSPEALAGYRSSPKAR